MFIKVIGFLIIVGTCSLVGLEISKELSGRVRVLSNWVGTVSSMQGSIERLKMPLDEIYAEFVSRGGLLSDFFSKVIGGDEKAWKREVCRIKYLNKKDIVLLSKLGSGLGGLVKDEQIKFLQYIKGQLEENLAEAKGADTNDGKMYKSVSFFAGIGLAVLLV